MYNPNAPVCREMDPRQLSEDEIKYELQIRGVASLMYSAHDDLARLLGHHLMRDPVPDKIMALDPEEELETLVPKIAEIQVVYQETRMIGNCSPEPKRLHSLYLHVSQRIRRIVFRARGRTYERLRALLKKVKRWHPIFETHFPGYRFPLVVVPDEDEDLVESIQRLQVNVGVSQGSIPARRSVGEQSAEGRQERRGANSPVRSDEEVSAPVGESSRARDGDSIGCEQSRRSRGAGQTKNPGRRRDAHHSGSSSDDDSSASSITRDSHRSVSRAKRRTNPVALWKLRYSGGEDLMTFLEDVEEMRDTHFVDEEDVLAGIGSLLTGSAKTWHKSMRHKICTWEAFKGNIRRAFMPHCDDDVILDRLKKMRQRQEETYLVYEARMAEQFNRLEAPLEEGKKLKFLLGGLHLFYRSRICSADVKTTRELRHACVRLEPDKVQLRKLENEKERYERVEKGKSDREKEDRHQGKHQGRRAYEVSAVERPAKKNDEVERASEDVREETFEGGDPIVEAAAVGRNAPTGPVRSYVGAQRCWRCGGAGHISLQCREAIYCISCGMQGVIAENCQRCAQARFQGYWPPNPTDAVRMACQPRQADFQPGAWNRGSQVPRMPAPLDAFPPPLHLPPPLPPQQLYPASYTRPTQPQTAAPQQEQRQGGRRATGRQTPSA